MSDRMTLETWICETCGSCREAGNVQPEHCPICEDERQYVAWGGQRWTRPSKLIGRHRIVFREEAGITTLALEPEFAIGQRAFLIPTGGRQFMWESLSLVTPEAVAAIKARGGLAAMAVSHPHFYAAMAEWSAAFNAPIYVHAADREWIQQPSPNIVFWEGERLEVAPGLTLLSLAGHFPGSTGLHWAEGPRAGGSLLPGDAIQVTMDRRTTTFMYSYPNAIPLNPAAVRRMRNTLAPFGFEDVFGYREGRQIIGAAKAAVDASFSRYLAAIADRIDVKERHRKMSCETSD